MASKQHIEVATGSGEHWLVLVREQVESLRFGTVQIVVHDGRVTQIDKTERMRVEDPSKRAPPPNKPS